MHKDSGVLCILLGMAASTGLWATCVIQSPVWLRGILFATLAACLIVLLIRRLRLHHELRRIHTDLQRAVQGHFHTRVLTGDDRILDDVVFSVNELIEQLEKVQVQTVRSESARRRLFSNISHDIRTPLTSMIGYTDALRDGVASSDEERKEYLDIIAGKAGKLKGLIDEIFLMAKLDADEFVMQTERVDLAEILRETAIDFWPDIQRHGIELVAHLPDRPCTVIADRFSLQRVAANLIRNSLLYGRDGKILGIGLSESEQEYIVQVWDKGAGIAKEELQRVFERTYRADSSRLGNNSGSGLGLPIAKSLVEMHGGRIWVESIPGEKTTLTFTVPKIRLEAN